MVKSEQVATEQEHHRKAFEFYYSLGGQRSMEKVAKELGVSVSTVKLWSRSFNWRQRLWEREANTARQIADRHLSNEIDGFDRHKKIVKMALLKVAKAIADGKVRIQMADLDRLICLEQLLFESVNEQGRQDGYFRSREDIQEFLESLTVEELAKLDRGLEAQEAEFGVPLEPLEEPDSETDPN
jgi:transposase-like protein